MTKTALLPSHQDWLQFKRPHVRDLAYAIACPPILLKIPDCVEQHLTKDLPQNLQLPDSTFWHVQFRRYIPRLQELENNPKPLNQFLGKHLASFRLGFRFEALLLFWLQDTEYHSYELLAHNVQLFSGKQTLGEIDFIVRDTDTNAIEHWEVAIKFLLGERPFLPQNWQGLKGTDNLHKKISHMLDKSLQHDTVIIDGKILIIDKQKLIIKGRFYEPMHEILDLAQTQLEWLNPELPRGKWYNHIPINTDSIKDTQGWRNARRVEWLTTRECYDTYDVQSVCQNDVQRRNPIVWKTGLYFNKLSRTDTVNTGSQCENAVMLRLDN